MDAHDTFHKDLSRSLSPTMEGFWFKAHNAAFKGFERMERVECLTLQSQGVDRYVFTPTRTVSLEEKCDYTTYDNVALEVESTAGYSAGWIEKNLTADLFAYGFYNKSPKVVYYFDTKELQTLWKDKKEHWRQQYGFRRVWSSKAIVCPVPIATLIDQLPHHYRVTPTED